MRPDSPIPLLSIHHSGQKTIWAVAGGKGGTGKSFVSANLAILLAEAEEEVVLIDADLGGPNLHTFLGMKDTSLDLGHFITNRVSELKDTTLLTPINRLFLIKGTENVLFTANLNYFKKAKLIRHIKAFDTQRVLIDVGTGASLNCIDFFLLSNPGILVVNPEPTSIENAYYFLKSVIIRLLKLYIDFYKIQDLALKITDQIKNNTKSIYSFLNEVLRKDKYYAGLLYDALKKFKPCLIINKARDEKDALLGESIAQVVQKYLALDLIFLGVIPFSEDVHTSLKKRIPHILAYPDSQVSDSLRNITKKLKEISS